jgi:hypothetical protein
MSFFGFLKREPLRAPEMPAVQTSTTAPPPATPDLYGEEIPPPPPSDAFLFDTKPGEVIIHDEVHHDADLDLLPKESPREPAPELSEYEPAPKAAQPTPVPKAPEPEPAPAPPPVHMELQSPTPRTQQEPKARVDWTSFPVPTAQMAQSQAKEERREPAIDLPDFTDDEINAAEQMMRRSQEEREREREKEEEKEREEKEREREKEEEERRQEKERDEAEAKRRWEKEKEEKKEERREWEREWEKEEAESGTMSERPKLAPILPPPVPDAFYVPAHDYQESLTIIGSLKAALKRGDEALSQMGVAMSSHTQTFAAFADEVNAVQESLMQMDNIMISQR